MDAILDWMPALITLTPERWIGLTRGLPAELLARRAAIDEWSAVECLQHLVDSEKVFQFRVEAFLAGRDFPNFDPETESTRPDSQAPQALAEEFARLRRESLWMIERLSPADLAHEAQHGELGRVTLSEMIHNWAAHDLNHTVQAECALMQPFIHGCGPWKKFFTDHLIGE